MTQGAIGTNKKACDSLLGCGGGVSVFVCTWGFGKMLERDSGSLAERRGTRSNLKAETQGWSRNY
jgi:hypothetical protein